MRYPEIDVLRTIAIVLMVVYHVLYDAAYLYGAPIDLSTPFWHLFQAGSASLFLLLVGISFVLSYQRVSSLPLPAVYRKYFVRGLRILGYGMIITIVTYFFDPSTYVRFGVLHVIGVSILVLPFIYALKEYNFLIGILCICIGQYMSILVDQSVLFLPFGVMYPGFETIDYFPLFPWIGVILAGLAVGHYVFVRYPQWRSKRLHQFFNSRSIVILGLPGRYSLLIYLVHQPLILLAYVLLYGAPHMT